MRLYPILNATRRDGTMLLEVLAASALVAAVLVSTLKLIRDGMAASRDVDVRNELAAYGVRTMEDQLGIIAATWATGTAVGDFTVDGRSDVRYSVVRTDAPGSGGITNRLMVVTATVWKETTGNATLDAGEVSLVYLTKVSKLAIYEDEATP